MKILNKGLLAMGVIAFTFGLVGVSDTLAAGPAAVNLGSAGNFVILGKTGVSTTGTTAVTGDIGVSPAAATYITGFGLTADVSNTFSTSPLVTGKIYASDYTPPTPTTMTTAISDMQTAYVDAAGRSTSVITELGAGNIGGMTLAPGLYKWGTGLTIPTDVTLAGSADDVWIFQVAQNLDISSATKVILRGGAQAKNIFWQVAGQTTIGTTAVFNGTILDQTAIVLNTGATLNGRALAQSAVTLNASIVNGTPSAAPALAPIPVVTPAPAQTPAPTTTGGGTYNTYTAAPVQTTTQTPASTATTDVLKAQLDRLTANLQALQAQARQQSAAAPMTPTNSGQQVKAITANFRVGSVNSGVRTLQEFLIAQNKGPAAQALARNGSTTRFGALTRAALAEFQASVGISPAVGNFGSITRAYIQANY